jgi:hypothetical protein
VDLVGHHAHVVPAGQVGEAAELVARPGAAERVVRVAEQHRAGACGEGPLDPHQVEGRLGGVRVEGHRHELATGHGHHVAEGRVAGQRHHDRPGRAERLERDPHAADDRGRRHHRIGRDVPRPVPRGEPGERRAQPAVAVRRVADRAGADAADQRVLDRLGEPEVHLGDPGRDRAGLAAAPLQRERGAGLVVGEITEHRPIQQGPATVTG